MINICDILEATEYFEITDNGPFAFFANFSKNTSVTIDLFRQVQS
jgi:hypothetical protein